MTLKGVFEKIADGELPAYRVYGDDHVVAFLDIGPVSPGHVLLIPRRPFEALDACDADTAAALGRALPKLVSAVRSATGCAGVNVLQNNGAAAGQVVMHVHFHLIPRYADGREGFGFTWPAGELTDEQARRWQAAFAAALPAGAAGP